jgi:N-acyl homoserine lactone hydrolase
LIALPVQPSYAQDKAGIERLYILYCGDGVAGDISLWSPGVNVGKAMDFSVNCYLIKHTQGWLLWDTGITDAIAAMPGGLGPAPANPRMTRYRRTKTLANELDQLSVKPSDIKYLAISHAHQDHVGNIDLLPQSMLLVQKAEYDWPALGSGGPRFKPDHPVTKLEGDHDVFGDGSVTIIATPGHTPGHQSLLVKLPKTGAVMLSGDAVHFKDNWENRRVPDFNTNRDQSLASMQRLADILAREKAQLWINHDKVQTDSLKMARTVYD